MIYLRAFLFSGIVCALSQYILEKTKLTPGHMNTILVIVGCVLSAFKIYDKIIKYFSAGATILIVNFGHLLVSGASEGFDSYGLIGLFKGVLSNASAGISLAVFCAFIISLFFKIKN